MNIWWIVLAIFVVAAISVLVVVMRSSRQEPRVNAQPPVSDRDFVQDREAARLGGMSEEDRAWQAASLDKDRATREGTPPDE